MNKEDSDDEVDVEDDDDVSDNNAIKRAGPKGVRAESARAVTGRRCPHSGKGKTF